MNKAAERITGIPREDAIGRPCFEVFRANICENRCTARETLDTKRSIMDRAVYIMTAQGKRIPVSVNTALLKDKRGKILGTVETFRDLTTLMALRKEERKSYQFADMVSRDPKMHEIFALLPPLAESGSGVLIEGESGTGKERCARAIHDLSSRKKGPFVAINCGALPDPLLESELFGYTKGAFTDAARDKPGRFALAKGGSIFLDEIGDISPFLQVKLLRVLQEKEFEPLGSTRTVKSDVRVIAASNKDTKELVNTGKLREDLYYRLNVVKVRLPPLREREHDIVLLSEFFIDHFNRIRSTTVTGLSDETMATFTRYHWPGNIRELQNAIEHAFILCKSGLIQPKHLPESFAALDSDNQLDKDKEQTTRSLAQMEASFIRMVLARNHYHKETTARELGIDRTTLYRKIKRFNLDKKEE